MLPAAIGPGSTLDRYEILGEIASGGMATVFLARAVAAGGFERMVAVKVCHAHLRSDDDFVAMFFDEARLAAKIHHPNVVPVLDVQDRDALFLVMEYIEGDRLAELVRAASRRKTQLPLGVALRIMIDALTGLHAAHTLRDVSGDPLHIVHRDVSPQNILVGSDGVSRLTDFGIAKAAARATVTREGQLKGKFAYMAPEQIASGPIDRRADVFAAGVVLWEALTTQRLFRSDSEVETMNLVLRAPIARPSTFAPGIPPTLDAVVERALARDPEKRFQSAAELADALDECGVKLASTRAVAECLMDLVGERVEARRQLITAPDGRPTLPEILTVDVRNAREPDTSVRSTEPRTDAGTPVNTVSAQTVTPNATRAPRGRRVRAGIAGVTALAGVATLAMGAWRFSHVPPRVSTRAVPATIAPAHAVTARAAPVIAVASAPPVVVAPVAALEPAVVLAQAPPTPVADASVEPVHHHRGARHESAAAQSSAASPPARFEPGAI